MNPIQKLEQKLKVMHGRSLAFRKLGLASTLNHFKVDDGAGKLIDLDEVFTTALNSSDEDKKVMAKMLDGSRLGNGDDAFALNELRQVNIELFVKAMSNFGLFYEPMTLKDNEQMVFVHSYKNPVNVKHIAQDGHIGTMKAVKAQKQIYVDMREIAAEVGYQIRDVNLGMNIAEAAAATVDLAWDMANKVDYEQFKMFINGGIFAPFSRKKGGASDALSATYIPHWRINTANLPPTNNLVLDATNPQVAKLGLVANGTGGGQSNLFRFDVVQAIIDYCESWGEIFGGKMEPTGAIIIPSSDVSGLTSTIKPTTLFFNEVAEGVLQNFRSFQYLNKNWVLIPDVTLDPGCCYVVMGKPVGLHLTKPSLDWEDVDTNKRKNWETRMSSKTLQLYVPEPSRLNALRVIYSSTYTDPTLN